MDGEYVNSADSIKTIYVTFTVLEFVPEYTEVVLVDSLSGDFSIKLPGDTSLGTHMRIQFEHVNGDITVHTQYVNVKQVGSNNDAPEGLFGIDSSTILGLDALLILILCNPCCSYTNERLVQAKRMMMRYFLQTKRTLLKMSNLFRNRLLNTHHMLPTNTIHKRQ